MDTRKLSEIIEDLRATANDGTLGVSAIQEQTMARASELEAILKKERADAKTALIVCTLALLFVGAFALITYMYNDDLREDVTQKKEIINQYERAVRHDTVITYHNKEGKEITVPGLLDDNMKLMNKINDLEYKVGLYEIKLQSIENRYGIKVVNDEDLFHIEGSKVDSAMLLLPVFRDRLSYDSVKNHWTVTRKSVKIGDKTYIE